MGWYGGEAPSKIAPGGWIFAKHVALQRSLNSIICIREMIALRNCGRRKRALFPLRSFAERQETRRHEIGHAGLYGW
jgi:hypothetical protein